MMTNLKLRQNSGNQRFNPSAFFFFPLTGDNDITILPYFASFTGYKDDMLKVFFYLHVQGSKIGRKMDQFGGKSKNKLNFAEFVEFVFSKSGNAVNFQMCFCDTALPFDQRPPSSSQCQGL